MAHVIGKDLARLIEMDDGSISKFNSVNWTLSHPGCIRIDYAARQRTVAILTSATKDASHRLAGLGRGEHVKLVNGTSLMLLHG